MKNKTKKNLINKNGLLYVDVSGAVAMLCEQLERQWVDAANHAHFTYRNVAYNKHLYQIYETFVNANTAANGILYSATWCNIRHEHIVYTSRRLFIIFFPFVLSHFSFWCYKNFWIVRHSFCALKLSFVSFFEKFIQASTNTTPHHWGKISEFTLALSPWTWTFWKCLNGENRE